MKKIGLAISMIAITGVGMYGIKIAKEMEKEKPDALIVEYMNHIEKQEYEAMYSMIDMDSAADFGKEEFIERNSKIYEGIEAKNLKLSNITVDRWGKNQVSVSYNTSLDTVAGEVHFENSVIFLDTEDGYKLLWQDSLIFPNLSEADKVSVSISPAKRGEILDRSGQVLAGKGTAISVGIVPGKLKKEKQALKKLADLLEIDVETIEKKLAAKWVKADSFVPIATIPKVNDTHSIKAESEKSVLKEQQRQEQILKIAGVMFSDVEIRSYPMEEAASHLIGYVQNVTAEDLENHAGEGYRSNSVIGRSGMEGLFERELKGKDGCEISIIDGNGKTKEVIASVLAENGENIQLTVDSELQRMLYEKFKDDEGCSVAINPYTGEVLALVSTPSYDNNDFIMGMSSKEWNSLNEDENKPLYNRFRQVWCPGSAFKPVVAGIGLKTGRVNPNEDFGNVGLSWQKDSSWGSYRVTTLHEYSPVIMKNAIIYSDNIYFAKAALKIGADNFMKSLDEMGFNQELPFEIAMSKSQYSNTEKIETEIQLADSGYGQGQILVNPLHLASIYTAFLNDGNIIKPYLRYKQNREGEVWISKFFTADIVSEVMKGVKGVVNSPHGTGYAAHRDDIALAGKTGTAEIKASKEDTTGTEIGWFTVFTADKDVEKPILIVSMVENVKGIGGSGYVVRKDKAVLNEYWHENIYEKGYSLPIDESEEAEAKREGKAMMERIQSIYKKCDKGTDINAVLSEKTIKKMVTELETTQLPVIYDNGYGDMGNYRKMETFLMRSAKGERGTATVYEVHGDGSLDRDKFIFDGEDMYVLHTFYSWSDDGEPLIGSSDYTRIREWKYTDRGWFCYKYCVPEPPEVTEIVNGSCLIRVKPMSKKNREVTEKCVRGLGYQGNNILCSNWDTGHMEELDYNGMYEYLYAMKYKESFPREYPDGIPKNEFESLIMEYLPVTAKEIRKYAVFNEKKQVYEWERLGCFNYELTYFGESVPEITNIRKGKDGTVVLTVNAVCEMILCDDAVITHELTVRFGEDGSFQYLGNKVLNDGISNIPDYQCRVSRKK